MGRQRHGGHVCRCANGQSIPAEALERRALLSAAVDAASAALLGDIFLDPQLVADMNTPRLRRAARGFEIGPDVIDPPPAAPPLGGTIEGPSFLSDGLNHTLPGGGSFLHIPPDPIGAAGPGHVLSIVNCTINWHTKAGVLQNNQRLGSIPDVVGGGFFAPLSPANQLFDPKVLYDQYDARFVVVALERTDTAFGDADNTSRILVAVSDDADPNGAWSFQAVNSMMSIGGVARWADYPGLGVDDDAVYVSNNMFGFGPGTFGGSRLWVFNKTGLYTGSTSTFTVHDPSAAVGIGGAGASTLQPAHMFGPRPGATGTFLVSSGFADGAGNDYVAVFRVNNPITAPAFDLTFVNTGNVTDNFFPALAPQPGTAQTIASGDGRAYNAVWRNNTLWLANTVSPVSGPDAGTATAHWYKVSATSSLVGGAGGGGAAGVVSDQGNVSGEDIAPGTRTFYPAVNVDADGNMGIGFSASGPSIFAGAYYTGRLASAPAGTLQSSAVLAAGVDRYFRAFGGTANRWGDYSGLALDPSDNATFWAFNLYAQARGTVIPSLPQEDGQWGTRWGRFALSVPNQAPAAVADAYDTDEDVPLSVAAPGVLANDTDADGNPLTAVLVSGASHGALALNPNGSFSYTPAADYNGPDGFTYKPNDSTADGNTVSVAITVNAVNDAPLAVPGPVSPAIGGDVTPGWGHYWFKVVYSDDGAINPATLGSGDVQMTGPGGYSQLGTLSNISSSVGVWTLTYRVPAPGGTWNAADNGTYTISLLGGEVADTTGLFSSAATLGTLVVAIPDLAPPAATLTAANITGPGTHHWFQVAYTDDTGIDFLTIGSGDVLVTGPAGYSQTGTLANLVFAAGTWTATYRVPAPGGTWDVADNGSYTVSMQAGEVLDVADKAVPAGPIGGFSVAFADTTAPTAVLTASDVTAPIAVGAAYYFRVAYSDDVAVAYATIGSGDVLVTGPGGYAEAGVLANLAFAAGTWTATYRVASPGGSWGAEDNGTYTVSMQPGQVGDASGNFVAAGALGTFQAAVPAPLSKATRTALRFSDVAIVPRRTADPNWATSVRLALLT